MSRLLFPCTSLLLLSCADHVIEEPLPTAVDREGGNCLHPATLEITSVKIGQGDATIMR